MKHICLKLVLFVLSVFTCLSVSAYDFEADGLYFTIKSLKDLTVSVDGAVNKDTCKIVIPGTVVYKGKTLTVISVGDKAFKDYEHLQSVSIPREVSSIGEYAFCGDKQLEKVVLLSNNRLTKIGSGAFWGTSISRIRLSQPLSSIGENAFRDTRLYSIDLQFLIDMEDIPAGCFANCSCLESIQWPNRLRSIGEYAFDGCKALTNFTIPYSVVYIDAGAFRGCEALTNFTIPPSVVEISPSIIWNCSNISKLTIGKGLNGLPFIYNGNILCSETSSLEAHNSLYFLNKLDTVIIEDAHDEFSIKGYEGDYNTYPAFSVELDYYYVGRPLIDISRWSSGNGDFHVSIEAPTGHIKKLEIAGTCTENPLFYQGVDTLILGKNIKSFYVDRLYGNYLDMIICKSTTPPVVCNGPFLNKVYAGVTLYVPKGCKDAYSNDPGWGTFWDIREFEDDCDTKVSNVTDNLKDIAITTKNGSIIVSNAPHNTLVQVYNLQGALVAKSQRSVINGLSKGAYLVNVGGKTFKVVL